MDETKSIEFFEGDLLIKTLSAREELLEAYRLRHKVFADQLKWVPATATLMETDAYDARATSVGLFSGDGAMMGMFRLLAAPGPFMLESEFRPCLLPGHHIRKERDTVEITRLTVDPRLSEKGLSSRLMTVLFKGVYQWSVVNEIRFLYMVVEKRFLRVLKVMGFPCEPISPPTVLPPAGVMSIAAILDWDAFRYESPRRQPVFFEWFSTLNATRPYDMHAISTDSRGPVHAARRSHSLVGSSRELVGT
ncbi:MAG: acyl-homoserine-lactone synthase [Nitrospiraceae bacterium]